jgi:exosortase O
MTNKASATDLDLVSDRSLSMAMGILMFATWLYANLASLQWLYDSLLNTSAFNLLLISSLGIGLIVLAVVHHRSLAISPHPVMRPVPLALMWGSAIASISLQWYINIDQISVLLFLLGSYGLLGLFMAPSHWRKGLPVAAIAACVIPFSLQFTSGLGFSSRVLTSHIVEYLLTVGHIAAVSSHDIIVLENGIAHVDLPCSGLRSLWMGTLFLLLATWLEKRKLGLRWLLVYVACLLLLIAANVGRVMLLVLTTYVLKQPQMAEILHTPFGLIGFASACGLTWLLLRLVPQYPYPSQKALQLPKQNIQPQTGYSHPISLTTNIVLVISMVVLTLLPRPSLAAVEPISLASIRWPTEVKLQPLPLTTTETEFFSSQSSVKTVQAEKNHFQFGSLSGSMLAVSSTSWRSHHAPELCFVGNGFKVNKMTQARLASDFPVRWLSLQNGSMTATYWFQSHKQTTDEFLSRIWSDLSHQNQSWVMVSILFDRTQSPDLPEVKTFTKSLHEAIALELKP